jgi:hypothetical protein
MKKFSGGPRAAPSRPRAGAGPRTRDDAPRPWAPARGSRGAARFEGSARPPRARATEGSDAADPYQRARRPYRGASEAGERFERRSDDRGEGRAFTVNLDPDVSKVFRGDASVNKALRLVIQLMQVVQGPPPRRREYDSDRPRPPRDTERRAAPARFESDDE